METTKLSSKGQITIPKWLRDAYRWETGLEFVVIDTGDGVLLAACPTRASLGRWRRWRTVCGAGFGRRSLWGKSGGSSVL